MTHNHPEGIKGAEATASAIYMARNGSSKEEIKEYIEKEFRYDLDRSLDKIRLGYHMDETCQKTVPEAIIAFLEARDFEDAIRNAVSLGGDTDTLGAITGSIAEAFYGIPAVLIAECRRRLDEGLMTDVLDEFDRVIGLSRLKAVHLNDSINGLGSHKDRHANLGLGEIGFDILNGIAHNERIKDVPKILETPYIDGKAPYKEEIDMLKNQEFRNIE